MRRHGAPTGPSKHTDPATAQELRYALTEARRHWSIQQEVVRGHERLYIDSILGIEVDRRSPAIDLDVARRDEWLLGLVVAELEGRVRGRTSPTDAPPFVRERVEEIIRLIIWSRRCHRAKHGHPPRSAPDWVFKRWLIR